MAIRLTDASIILATAFFVAGGCSTISQTEKQLSRVDSYDSPDIPSIGELPPLRPRQAGLAYSPNTLIISYDETVGKEPLVKAVAKFGAEILYDYSIINALSIRIPEGKTLDESAKHFRKVKGVIEVSKNSVYHID